MDKTWFYVGLGAVAILQLIIFISLYQTGQLTLASIDVLIDVGICLAVIGALALAINSSLRLPFRRQISGVLGAVAVCTAFAVFNLYGAKASAVDAASAKASEIETLYRGTAIPYANLSAGHYDVEACIDKRLGIVVVGKGRAAHVDYYLVTDTMP
jgi:hypothetical protein